MEQTQAGCEGPIPHARCYETLVQLNALLLQHWDFVRSQEGKPWDIIVSLYCAVQDSTRSLVLLLRRGHVRDSFSIARCIFETALNASYILAAGDAVADRALRHYWQKSLREIDRDMEFMKVFLDSSSETPDWRESSKLKELLDEFTDSAGREKTWAATSYKGRLDAIRRRFGAREERMLRVAMHAIYRPASEILHGTFYGAMLAAGQAKVPNRFQCHSDFIDWLGEQVSLVVVMSSAAIAVMLSAIGDVCGRPDLGQEAVATVLTGAKYLSSLGAR